MRDTHKTTPDAANLRLHGYPAIKGKAEGQALRLRVRGAVMRTDPRDEVLQDLIAVRNALRVALPLLMVVAAKDDDWPDTLLADVAAAVAQAVERLDAAAGLLDSPQR